MLVLHLDRPSPSPNLSVVAEFDIAFRAHEEYLREMVESGRHEEGKHRTPIDWSLYLSVSHTQFVSPSDPRAQVVLMLLG